MKKAVANRCGLHSSNAPACLALAQGRADRSSVVDFSVALILSLLWFALVVWLIGRAFRQRHALCQLLPRPHSANEAPKVAVIVPARNESANIGPCIDSLVRQDYPAERLHVIVVDDDSCDDTAAIVASRARHDNRITLLRSPPLPFGWKGKVNACCAGVRVVPDDVAWLCFLDADMRAEPPLIGSAVAAATEGKIDLLSLAPRHELLSFAERLIIPCGLFLLSFSQDLAQAQAPDSQEVVATGQFMLLRRDAYDAVGGHATVCNAICEDLELARLVKERGRRVLLEDGSKLLTTRMYTGWSTLWPGIAKNLTDMLGGPLPTIATALFATVMAWAAIALPALALVGWANGATGASAAAVPALLGALAAFGLHIAGASYFRIPLWYGLLFPIGYTAGSIIALDSLRWRLTGRVRWKGRVYQ
jgi:chlorobactene glucosyltransferase